MYYGFCFIERTAMKRNYQILNSEVIRSIGDVIELDNSNIDNLKQLSDETDRGRIRFCSHAEDDDLLHEMFIVHQKHTYVRPHKHMGKVESVHIIEGLVDIVLFDDSGNIENVIFMGDYSSGKTFYYRMHSSVFHTLIIRSNKLVFHEITNGPFKREDTIFAPWSPEGGDQEQLSVEYLNHLRNEIQKRR